MEKKAKNERKRSMISLRNKRGRFLIGLAFIILILFPSPFFSSPFSTAEVKAEIEQVLNRQKEAWNRGDLEGFMAYYWNSEDLTFQSGANRLRGWKALMERYQKSYSGEKMGQLDFTDVEVFLLGSDYAYVLGRWKLQVQQETKEGLFTLIWRRLPEGWRIIHDHTS